MSAAGHKPLKVLQVLGGGAWGGGSVVVLSICQALLDRGDQVWVVVLDEESERNFRNAGCVPVRVPAWFRPISPVDIIPLAFLWQLCRKERFDLVCTHTSKGGILGRLSARWAGVPNIIHYVHGFGFHQFTHPAIKRVYVAMEQLAARCEDRMITVGEEHRQIAIREGIESAGRIHTILNGIDIRKFQQTGREQARRELGFAPDETILGSIGRLAPQKGFAYMIQAMPAILASHPKARLVLAGTGPLEEELRALAQATGVEANVTFLGFRRDVPQLLAAFDLFVHPSLWEGLSISLMEAMIAGCPIVCSRIPGNIEMIRHAENGLLAEPAEPSSLAAQVNRMLDHPGFAREVARRAQREGIERFSVERMVRENVACYDATIARAAQPQPALAEEQSLVEGNA